MKKTLRVIAGALLTVFVCTVVLPAIYESTAPEFACLLAGVVLGVLAWHITWLKEMDGQ